MKDELDHLTQEIPLLETPLQILKREFVKRGYATEAQKWRLVQVAERHGLKMGDLEMLVACRDWRKEQAQGSSTRARNKATVIPLWIHRR